MDAPEVDARQRDAARLQVAPDVAVHRGVGRLRCLLRRLRLLRLLLLLGLLRVLLRARGVVVVHAVVDGVLFVHCQVGGYSKKDDRSRITRALYLDAFESPLSGSSFISFLLLYSTQTLS